MSNERSDTSSSGRQTEADDLKLINGIGPVVEKRLYGIGIFTFAQLAALSPADIAAAVIGISGLTSERIIKQDWIGQARKLARQSMVSDPDWIEEEMESASPFTEGSEGAVAPTEEIETALSSMEESGDVVVRMEEREAVPPVAEDTPLRATIAPHPVGELRVRELKVVERGTTLHRNTLPSELPFDVQLTVDLTGQAELTRDSLEYGVQIYAKRLEDRARYTLAEARGAISLNEIITITAQSKTIPQGTYRLWANVTILATDKATTQSILSAAHAKGGMLLIY